MTLQYRGVNVVTQEDGTFVLRNEDGSFFDDYSGFFWTAFAARANVDRVLSQ